MTTIIKRKNFTAKLPDDYVAIISIEKIINFKNNKQIYCTSIMSFTSLLENKILYNYEYFTIDRKENKIYFCGSFSRYWLIRIFQRIFQKISEHFFPQTYLLKYLTNHHVHPFNISI